MKIEHIILNISESEKISEDTLKKYISSFEKYIKSEIRKYDDTSGLDDFKMNKYDYNILYQLYNQTNNSPFKLNILLLYMYSYYKLDGINFNRNCFPFKIFFNFINSNENIHSLLLNLVTIKIDKKIK